MSVGAPNQEFLDIWAEAEADYIRVTGHSFKDFVRPNSAKELEYALTNEHGKFVQARGRGKNPVLHFLHVSLGPLQAVSDIVIGGASMAFPPAGTIWAAANFLIGAADGVSAAYDSIEELFSRLEDFMVRLQHYTNMPKVDQDLRRLLAKILRSLLLLIAMQTKITQNMPKHRIKEYFRQLGRTDDASEVQGELANLDKLTQQENALGVVLIQENLTVEMSRNQDFRAATEKIQAAQIKKLDEEAIKNESFRNASQTVHAAQLKKLDEIADAITESKEDPVRKVRKVLKPDMTAIESSLKRNLKPRLAGTCEWIFNKEVFRLWADGKGPVLRITGKEGAGKTVLAAAIIEQLQSRFYQGAQVSSKVSVAYFFYENKATIPQMLKTMSYMIAKSDKVYCKQLESIIGDVDDTSSIDSLWRMLFNDPFTSEDGENSVVLVIDGLDSGNAEQLGAFQTLIEELQESVIDGDEETAPRIKLLLVSRPDGELSMLLDDEDSITKDIPIVEILPEDNQEDINNFIQSKLAKLTNLKDEDRQYIVETLGNNADGMFRYISLTIDEILHKRMPQEMRNAVDRLPKGLDEAFHRILQRFSTILDEDAIIDLNIFLEWVACAEESISLENLNQIIQFQRGYGPYAGLEHDLRKKYASLFVLQRSDNLTSEDLVSEEVLEDSDEDESFMEPARNSDADSDTPGEKTPRDGNSTSDPLTTYVKINHSIYEYFSKKGKAGTQVGVDLKQANLNIVLKCMELISDKFDDANSWLADYASCYWFSHLKDVQSLEVPIETKQTIAGYILRLLHNREIMAKWRVAVNIDYLSEKFFLINDNIEAFQQWLTGLDDWQPDDVDDAAWLKTLVEDPKNFKKNILQPLAMHMAEAWLTTDNNSTLPPFIFLHLYLQMIDSEDINAPLEWPDLSLVTEEQILNAARWPNVEENAIWNFRMAQIQRDAGHLETAIEYFKKAIELEPENGIALSGLARTYGKQEMYSDAVALGAKALPLLGKEDTDYEDLSLMAEWYKKANDEDKAIEMWHMAIQLENVEPYQAMVALFQLLDLLPGKKRFGEVCDIIKELNTVADSETYSRLVEYIILCYQTYDANTEYLIMQPLEMATCKEGQSQLVLDIKRAALHAAKKRRLEGPAIALRASLASSYYKFLNEQEKAERLWKRVVADPAVASTASLWYFAKTSAFVQLSQIYLDRALGAKAVGEPPNTHIEALQDLAEGNSESDGQEEKEEDGDEKQRKLRSSTRIPTLFLGAWYNENGEQQKARAVLKEHVLLALELLSDKDDSNDGEGFRNLAMALLKYGDVENAKKAFAMRRQFRYEGEGEDDEEKKSVTEEVHKLNLETNGESTEDATVEGKAIKSETAAPASQRDPSPKKEEEDKCPSPAWCNGRFGTDCPTRDLYYNSNHNTCIFCYDVDFCNHCAELVKEGKLSFRDCSARHKFFNLSDLPVLERGKVSLGEEVVPWQDWVKALKADWSK
ncbi:hypothetical protein F5884DRAFT_827981 [Xylogone sp. PMI_703]|nr:hypothetical protein F5884DRAFT_827981 [Xylogone sp. PMI_703]